MLKACYYNFVNNFESITCNILKFYNFLGQVSFPVLFSCFKAFKGSINDFVLHLSHTIGAFLQFDLEFW